jgi:hypothetical protein
MSTPTCSQNWSLEIRYLRLKPPPCPIDANEPRDWLKRGPEWPPMPPPARRSAPLS